MDRDVHVGIVTMAIGFMGVLIAAIVNTLNTEGTLVDEFITGSVTITDLMSVIIIIFLVVAVVYAVTSR